MLVYPKSVEYKTNKNTMLHLHQSNRLENLLALLCELLADAPEDPFVPETIVVQNPGMGRWLQQQIARHNKIAANIDFPLPARFAWDLLSAQLSENIVATIFDKATLCWKIFDLLPKLGEDAKFTELNRYLENDPKGIKGFQFADKLSEIFDQYLVYRPEMLLEWENGSNTNWQAGLWRMLCDVDRRHRAALMQQFRAIRDKGEIIIPEQLRRKIYIFGISSLAPVYLEIIASISELIEIHIFHFNPCRLFWEDLISARELAKKRTNWLRRNIQDVSEYYETGNPLLSSLGHVGKDFIRQLLECERISDLSDLYQENSSGTILSRLHNDILDLIDSTALPDHEKHPLRPDDRSVQFHVCHSPLREVQVLHDTLLGLFEMVPDLQPGDILVMTPDIGRYAYLVAGVFGHVEKKLRIPWSIADRTFNAEIGLFRTFSDLLDLFSSRFTATEVLSFLENPEVLRRFKLNSDDLERIRNWTRQSSIRWGLDKEHWLECGIEDAGQNSWSFGIDRLLLGSITGPDENLYQALAPCPVVKDNETKVLAGLIELMEKLKIWRPQLLKKNSPEIWRQHLQQLLTDFFAPGDSDEKQKELFALRDLIDGLGKQWRQAKLSASLTLEVIKLHFKKLLKQSSGGHAFLNGRVTFCNMIPMRSIPFKVICLLGMNDIDYPRSQQAAAFDMIAANPRLGDRNRRNDDRYLFLESLLSAREIFSISWIGRDQHDNSYLPPSIVVDELRDYIDRSLTNSSRQNKARLTIEHPLQAFSRRCFAKDSLSRSYAGQWLPDTTTATTPVFLPQSLPEPDNERFDLTVGAFARFWRHPVRFFMQEQLGLYLREQEITLQESEPFQLSSLDQYVLNAKIAATIPSGQETNRVYEWLQATGGLPHKQFGRHCFRTVADSASKLVNRFQAYAQGPRQAVEINIRIANFQITGQLPDLYSSGRVVCRGAKLKAGDLMTLWVNHLFLNHCPPKDVEPISIHIATNKTARLGPVTDSEKIIKELLALYLQGCQKPLSFYPETSLAWFLAKEGRKQAAAEKTWNLGYYHQGEGEDIYYKTALKGTKALGVEFVSLTDLFIPLYGHLEELDANA